MFQHGRSLFRLPHPMVLLHSLSPPGAARGSVQQDLELYLRLNVYPKHRSVLQTGILVENAQGHMDNTISLHLRSFSHSRLCFVSHRTFNGLESLNQQTVMCMVLCSLQRICPALVLIWSSLQVCDVGRSPVIPTLQVPRAQGLSDCERSRSAVGSGAVMEGWIFWCPV